MAIEVSVPVQHQRDVLTKQANDANIRLEQLKAAYRDDPAQKLELDRLALERLRNDPFHLDKMVAGSAAAQREETAIVARIRVAEAAAAGQAAAPDDPNAPDVTYGQQVSRRDLTDAVATLVEHGNRPTLIESFLATGRSDGGEPRETEIAAAREWQRRLLNDPELQKKFLAKDPEVMRQFDAYGVYAPDPRLT
jgi:hypothetical protein